MRVRGGVGRAGWGMLLCAGAALAQGGSQEPDPEWIERLRAANAALRAELQELHRRVTALEGRPPAAPPSGGARAGVAPLDSATGAGSPEELAAAVLADWERTNRGLWAFDARGLLPGELAAALPALESTAPPSAAGLRVVLEELASFHAGADLTGVAVRRRPPRSPQSARVGVAEVEVSLLLARTRRERTLQLLVFEVGGRWQLAQCEAPWLAANARAALGVLGKSKGWTHEAVTEALDTAGVTWGLRDVRGWSHHDVFDRRQLRLPGYDLLGDDRLTARPRLPGLTPLSGKSPAPFSQQLREAPSLQTRLELCEAQIAASTSAGEVEVARAARLERARTRLALARRAVLADPAFELVPRIGAILAEDPTGLDGAAGEALRVRLYRAAGDPSRASLDEKAAEALASDGWCQIQAGRSLVTQEGKHNAAEVALWQSVNEARREGDRSLEAEALAGVAEAYWTVGQLERAQEALTAALTAEPATAPAQALRVLLALERLEPLTEELVAAAEVARRLDRCEPLAHLACVRVALARGDLTAADHALTLAQQAIAPWSQRHYQAALDLALAQGRRDLGHLLAEWGSRVDRLITEAEAAWLEPGGAAPSAATLAEIAQQTEPLTPRQRARLERLSDGAFAPTDMAGLRKVWQPVLLKDPGISTISERGDTLRIGVEDEAAAARVRALPGFLRHCERSNVPVLVEVVGRVRNLEAEEPPAPGAR